LKVVRFALAAGIGSTGKVALEPLRFNLPSMKNTSVPTYRDNIWATARDRLIATLAPDPA
jgi:hypothetical protein